MGDESIRRHAMNGNDLPPGQNPTNAAMPPRRMAELDRAEALALLGSVPLGRIVFTHNAQPAIRPVNHLLERGQIIIRTHAGAALTRHAARAGQAGHGKVVVAYEAEDIDPHTQRAGSRGSAAIRSRFRCRPRVGRGRVRAEFTGAPAA
jgi:hypothetical protein